MISKRFSVMLDGHKTPYVISVFCTQFSLCWGFGSMLYVLNYPGIWWHCQEFSDSRDADDARHYLNGKEFDGNRLIVEFARRVSLGAPLFTACYLICLFTNGVLKPSAFLHHHYCDSILSSNANLQVSLLNAGSSRSRRCPWIPWKGPSSRNWALLQLWQWWPLGPRLQSRWLEG
jgi:hypothetical protein